MRRKIATFTALLTLGASLSGCATLGANTEDDFFCEAQKGSPCTTISGTDGTGVAKTIGVTETVEDTLIASVGGAMGLSEKESLGLSPNPPSSHAYETARYRIAEELSQLWIAPYLDENQLFHQGRYVHFVVRDAQWITR